MRDSLRASLAQRSIGDWSKSAAQTHMTGTDSALKRRFSMNATAMNIREGGMENFLLFVLSSSFCTLVADVTLLLRPLVGLP
jgi:hypothetical protein